MLVAAACGGSDDDDDAGGDNGGSEQPAEGEEVSTEIDRSGRFAGLDSFCEPFEGEPEEEPEATEDGITEDSIVLSHIRVKLEDLEGIGFAVDIGDPADQAETFVKVVNEECGGIHGRQLDLNTIEMEVPGLSSDADADAQRVCIEASEDQKAVFTYSLSGAGGALVGCLTGAHDVIFTTTYAITESDLEQSEGRLFSVNHSSSDIMRIAVKQLADDLEGKRIGVVHADNTGDPQIVQQGLIQALEEEGLEIARVDVIGCNNSSRCNQNIIPSVQGMIADNVDVIFPLLNVVSLPGYLQEMVTQGVKPGDVQFYNVGFLAQDGELVTGKIVEFAGEEAGALYDGAVIISGARGGQHRESDYEPTEFQAMCNRVYAEHSDVVDQPYDPRNDDQTSPYGAVAGQCAVIRMFARAVEEAGPNPTREEIAEALRTLGGVDLASGGPGSFNPDKTTAPDATTRVLYRYPCPTETTNKSGSCLVPQTDFETVASD